ncbi:MAG: ATP synthase F1 subunit delta [Kiritimatiellae bacterium]|nr:ATP synthase F1 subunit delta [Kiritimatiellia bacterium]MDW8459305.1 ATP synthase F1 subunit delta [Verrucomicrobiota bacterium]
MRRSPVIRRYARALFELVREERRLDEVEADVRALYRALQRKEVADLLLDPRVARNRDRVWGAILGPGAQPLLLRFIRFLYFKNRIAWLREILEEFCALCDEARGLLVVEIKTAAPMPPEQADCLLARLSPKFGRTLRPAFVLDPSLIGGFRIQALDRVVDASLSKQLERLHRTILAS